MSDELDTITGIIRDLFDEYDGPVTRTLTAKQVPQWDSLAHVQLIVMVEQAFGIRFASHEVREYNNLGELLDTVVQRRARR